MPDETTTPNLPSDEKKCDVKNPDDPHHGEAGHYDEDCNWIPSV